MTWGSFGATHIATLIFAAAIIFGLHFALRKAGRKLQIAVLGILSFSGIAAIIFNLLAWNSPLEYLPLHLCSINALLLPIVVFTRSKTLGNLLLVWCLGALAALVVNMAQAEYVLTSWTFVFYYFPPVLEFGTRSCCFPWESSKSIPNTCFPPSASPWPSTPPCICATWDSMHIWPPTTSSTMPAT